MNDIQYNLQFEKLCVRLQLGEIIGAPEIVFGGFLHRMYALQTTGGKYAVKALNPQIMLRPAAMGRYVSSEHIARIAAKSVPALPARSFNGACVQEVDGQFYLVYDWVDAKSLGLDEINVFHCIKIGTILAAIHMSNFSESGIAGAWSDRKQLTDWGYYLQKGRESSAPWVELLAESIAELCSWDTQAVESAKLLASDMVISHRDLDAKNVLWSQDEPIIIDWESAGYVNPMQELTEVAIYWSENSMKEIDKERFLAFIDGYKKRYGTLQADWGVVLANGFSGKLLWLEYSLKRSLWIECTDSEEQQMGTSQVTETINAIRHYARMLPELKRWLDDDMQ